MPARSDLFAAAVKTAYTKTTSAKEPSEWTMGGRVLCLHAAESRVRVRQIEVSCASITIVTMRLGKPGIIVQDEGSGGTPSEIASGNLNQEGVAVATAKAYKPAADASNYGNRGTPYNILVARVMPNMPTIWRFDHHEVRLGKDGVCVIRVSPASDGDVVTATMIWEELG